MAIFKDLAQPRTTAGDRDSARNSAQLGMCVGFRAPPSPDVAPPNKADAERSSSLLAALPDETQARLRAIGGGHRTEFGTCRRVQAAFDQHIGFFDELISRGADHKTIGKLLADVGIARADGSPLPIGTVSGALSRARERARAAGADINDQPASPPLQSPAGPRRLPQDPAGRRRPTPGPTVPASAAPHPTLRGMSAQVPHNDDANRTPPDPADLLNRLRTRSSTGADHE